MIYHCICIRKTILNGDDMTAYSIFITICSTYNNNSRLKLEFTSARTIACFTYL